MALAERLHERKVVPLEGTVNLTTGGTAVRPIVVRRDPLGFVFSIPRQVYGGNVSEQVASVYQQEMIRASGVQEGFSHMQIGDLLNYIWGTERISDFHQNVEGALEYTRKRLSGEDNPIQKEELLAYAVGNLLAYRHGELKFS
jgi:hypothetical protein